MDLRFDHDLVGARQRARAIAEAVGFDPQDQSRIATAVSELARNALRYAGHGRVSFTVIGGTAPQLLGIEVSDKGPGIPHLDEILSGRYRSRTGMGIGIIGTRRLMDRFEITSGASGTTVQAAKLLPRRAALVTPRDAERLAARLMAAPRDSPLAEVEAQNRELLAALEELRRKQEELTRLNRELEETNRGVVALYAELDEKADHLRRADELKSRFLSNMTHEFRTPVSSILAISRILLDRMDGDLTSEQEQQVTLIHRAASDLSELVTDLLDLAKVEAGKTVIRPSDFRLADVFAALRGMLRPLLLDRAVALVFEDADDLPPLFTDESKVSQILRNFISNALKFTERGEVRVRAGLAPDDAGRVEISVADTGIGIAPEHLDTIFEEFSQIENPVQRHVRGTGLGLPLSRRLARLLGGAIAVESTAGAGSTFTLSLPVRYTGVSQAGEPPAPEPAGRIAGLPLLVVEDSVSDLLVFRSLLADTEFAMMAAGSVSAALQIAQRTRPAAIILDVQLGGEQTWGFLSAVRDHPTLAGTPVVIVSAIDDVAKGLALGAADYGVKPVERDWLLGALRRVTAGRAPHVLVVDEHEGWRDVLGDMLARLNCRVSMAANAGDGVMLAVAERPSVVCTGLGRSDEFGPALLRGLRDAHVSGTRVIIVSGRELVEAEAAAAAWFDARIVTKADLGRPDALAVLRELVYEEVQPG
jgi:signal transduction histidine kinase/DNA-binding response OmpR family regulator